MPAYFFDSSASVKRFAKEAGSSWILGLLRPSAQNLIYVSSLSLVEVTAAIARRRKGKTINPNQANKSVRRFRRSFEERFLLSRLLRNYSKTPLILPTNTNFAVTMQFNLPLRLKRIKTVKLSVCQQLFLFPPTKN